MTVGLMNIFSLSPYTLMSGCNFKKSSEINTTSFPGSLILPPRASEERPWLSLVTCYFDNWQHQGGVLCNQAVCRVELCRAATAPAIVALALKLLIASIPTFILRSRDFLPWSWCCCRRTLWIFMASRSYVNCGRRAVQFYSITAVSPLKSRDQIDKKKNVRMPLESYGSGTGKAGQR